MRAYRASGAQISVHPVEEPVSRTEAKLHLRVDGNEEDDLIDSLLVTARIHCENVSRRAFVTRTCTVDLWGWHDLIALPYPPLASVVSIVYTDAAGAPHTLPSMVYGVDTHSEPGLVYLAQDQQWPADQLRDYAPIRITYTAGYGDAEDVPETYKAAIKLYLAHLYENREAVVAGQGVSLTRLQDALDALLLTDRGSW